MGNMLLLNSQEKTKNKYSFLEDLSHGFLVLSNTATVSYKVDNSYAPAYDAGIRWDDPTLNIQWGVNESEVLVSEKDAKLPFFSEFETPFTN